MALKIEHNVPLPEPEFRRSGKWITVFSAMKPGDSFALDGETIAISCRQSLYRYIERKAPKAQFTVRKTGPGTYRCWRVR